MWKILKNQWKDYFLPQNNDLLFYIDNLLFFHRKHLRLRKKIAKIPIHIYEKDSQELELYKRNFTKIAKEQEKLNRYIKSFFILTIIETSKILEDNEIFKNELNKNITIINYDRLRNWNKEKVTKISNQIKHFRDACVHNKNKEISKMPEFKENNINWGEIHLEFTYDGDNEEQVFMIWEWMLKFKTVEKIIEEILKHFKKNTPFLS